MIQCRAYVIRLFPTIALLFVLLPGLTNVLWAQSDNACPKIEVVEPRIQGKYFGRGETYLIGAVVNPAGDAELQFRWELSPNVPFKEVDPASVIPVNRGVRYISFVATPDLQSMTIDAAVIVDGLPTQCNSSAETSFKIEYNTESPRVVHSFSRNLSPDLRETNLFISTDLLKNADNSVIALFVINYSKADKKQTLRKYVDETSDLLINRFNFPQNKFAFAFRLKNDKAVTVYGWPTEKNQTWETNIDRLDIPD